MLDKGLIGRRSDPMVNEVERGAVRRFAEALGLGDEAHFDEEAAQALGFRGLLAPLTFPTTFESAIDLREALALGQRGLLHADQSFEYFRPICAGDRIEVVSVIADVSERMGVTGPMDLVVVEDEGRDEQGQLVFRSRKTLLVRPAPREA
jgi:acyl dehydratase